MVSTHSLMDGKLNVYRRESSPYWQCATFIGGRNHRATTKETELLRAEEFARGWYAERLVDERRRRRGDISQEQAIASARTDNRRRKPTGPTFREAAEIFLSEFELITGGDRSPIYVKGHRQRLDLHLLPYFGDKAVASLTSGDVTAYRADRMKDGLSRKAQLTLASLRAKDPSAGLAADAISRPARSTIHQEIVCLRQVLKTALRRGWIGHLPDLSEPYRKAPKVSHRAWFSPAEYKTLYEATRARAKQTNRFKHIYEDLHDFVLFMVNTGLRPDEALGLQYRDMDIVTDEGTGERILEIAVRGKRGTGYCKSMPGAVLPFTRWRDRHKGTGSEPIFPKLPTQLFATVLTELDLKSDREGNPRAIYSLRHTYISRRLLEGADIYQLAKNCRTSVEMIEKHYAVHIKDMLDASATNVRKAKSTRPTSKATPELKTTKPARKASSRLAKRPTPAKLGPG